MKNGDIEKLPKFVGIAADLHYARKDWIYNLVKKLNPNTVVVIPEGSGLEQSIRDIVLLRGDLYLRQFEPSVHERQFLSKAKQNELVDYMFLSYLKFNDGFLFVFPKKFVSSKKSRPVHYSRRLQDIIINAYTIGVRSDVIKVEN